MSVVMNKVSLFLAKHSQKLALVASFTGIGVAYLIQPHYEMFTRWSLVRTHAEKELRPSAHLQQITHTVCEYFDLTREQKAKLDVFMTGLDQPVSIGSLSSFGYAFIGLPFFTNYSNALEIPTDGEHFYTRHFPHGPYSELGKRSLELMVLPEPALRFVIARELVRLGAKPKNGPGLGRSARFKSMVTVTSMTCGLYAAYQLSFMLNRAFRLPTRWTLPARLLVYTATASLGLFCQWQFVLAWRRSLSLRVDRIVAQIDPSLLTGGLSYYDWRLQWNRFWYDRAVDYLLARANTTKDPQGVVDHDPIKIYQDEQLALQQQSAGQQTEPPTPPSLSKQAAREAKLDQETGYFLPRIDGANYQSSSTAGISRPDASSLHVSTYAIHPRLTACGNERWAADGDGLAFGLTEFLALGYTWSTLARLLALFSYPATSESRLTQLQALSDQRADHQL